MSPDSLQNIPEPIREKYRIVFSQNTNDNTILFRNDQGKYGILKIQNILGFYTRYSCIVQPEFNRMDLNQPLNLIKAVQHLNDQFDFRTNRYFLFDTNGKLLLQLPEGDSISIDQYENIIIRKSQKHGLLNRDLSELMPPRYSYISAINSKYLSVQVNGKKGFIRRDGTHVLDLDYDQIISWKNNEHIMVTKEDAYYTLEFEPLVLKQLPFDKILRSYRMDFSVPSESRVYFQSIMNFKENNPESLFDLRHPLLNYRGNWGAIDGFGNIVIPNVYSYVDFFENPNYFKVALGEIELEEYEDREGYDTFSLKNVKWGVIDKNNQIVVPIIYDWIQELAPTIWAVYMGCTVYYDISGHDEDWEPINGKVGIYNHDKLIVPVEYAEQINFYYHINNYVYVRTNTTPMQDGTSMDYDAYTLDGIKVEENKPKRWLEYSKTKNTF